VQAIRGLVGEVAEADPAVAVGVISSCGAEGDIPYSTACRALGVSESWYYRWRDRPPTARAARRQHPAEEIEEIFRDSGGTYGSPRAFIEPVRRSWRISVDTVAKVMAGLGPAGRRVRRRRSPTGPGRRLAAPDLVRRDFTAEEPDLVRAGDMTEIETGEGTVCLATVIDLFSRRLLGCARGERHDADLVVASLDMAAATRGGDVRGVIMHTDRGSEYCSRRFRRACRKLGIVQSMGRVGSCFDNAVSEAFHSMLKVGYVHRHSFRIRTEARIRIATWITDFCNARRLYSVCGFKSPIDCERDYRATLAEGLAA
jgi:putative transposase